MNEGLAHCLKAEVFRIQANKQVPTMISRECFIFLENYCDQKKSRSVKLSPLFILGCLKIAISLKRSSQVVTCDI